MANKYRINTNPSGSTQPAKPSQEEVEALRLRLRQNLLLETPDQEKPTASPVVYQETDAEKGMSQMSRLAAGLPVEGEKQGSGRKMREGWLPWLGATGVRLGGGLLSAPGLWEGAGVSSVAETIAQKIESPDPIDEKMVALEAGIGAIPFGRIVKMIKPGISVGKQLLANAGRMAGYVEGGNMLRRAMHEGDPMAAIPDTPGEIAMDLGTTLVGAKLANLHPKFDSFDGTPGRTVKSATRDLAEAIEGHTGTIPEPVLVKTKSGAKSSPTGEVPISKSKINTDIYREEAGVPSGLRVGAPTRTVELPKDPIAYNEVINARSVEGAPLPQTVQMELDAINSRPSKVPREWLDPNGKPLTPEAQQILDHEDKIKELAKRKVMEKFYAAQETKPAERLAKQEAQADREAMRSGMGGTDIGKIKVGEEKAAQGALKERVQAAKAETTAADMVAKEEKQARAQAAIDKALEDMEPGTPTVTEVTERVPTATGSQTLRQSFRPKVDEDFAEGAVIDDITPAPAAPATPKPVIPQTDPNIVATTTYPTQFAAQNAAAGSGRRVSEFRRLGRGKWQVVFEDEVAQPLKTAPEATITEPPIEPPSAAPSAPVAPPEPPKGPSGVGGGAEVAPPGREGHFKLPEKHVPDEVFEKARESVQAIKGTAPTKAPDEAFKPNLAVWDGIERRRNGGLPAGQAERRASVIEKDVNPPKPPQEPPAAPVVAKPKPAPKKPSGGAAAKPEGVAFAITKDTRQRLHDLGYSKADIDGMKPQQAQDLLKAGTSKAKPEAPKAEQPVVAKMSKREIDAATREDVAKWTPDEIKAAQAKWPKDKRLQTILSDELKARETNTQYPGARPVSQLADDLRKDAPQAATKAPETPSAGPEKALLDKSQNKSAASTKAAKGENVPPTKAKDPVGPTPTKVTVDLAGAKDAKEVRNRVVNELQKYRQQVQRAIDDRGVDEKGQYTYPTPLPRSHAIEVPNGPTYTFKPDLDQIDNALGVFEKGATISGARANTSVKSRVTPEDAFRGIVDEVPAQKNVSIKTGYGTNFNSESGSAPSYKLPIAPVVNKAAAPKPIPANRVVKNLDTWTDKELAAAKNALAADDPIVIQAEAELARRQKLNKPEPPTPSGGGAKPAGKKTGLKVKAQDRPTSGPPEGSKAETPNRPLADAAPDKGRKAPKVDKVKASETSDILSDLALREKDAWDKYFDLKAAVKTGKATQEELRAAGKAAGGIRAELAQAVKDARAKGEPIPSFAQQQADGGTVPKPKAQPKGKGPTNEDIAKLPPDQQEAAIEKVVAEFKGKKGRVKNEKGEINTILITRLGLSATGALAGAAMTPDDPLAGAIIGGSVGFYAPAMFRAMARYTNKLPQNSSARQQINKAMGQQVKDWLTGAAHVFPDYMRAAYLARIPNLMMNSWAGPYGAAVMGSLEAAIAGDKRGWAALGELGKLKMTAGVVPTPKFLSRWKGALKEADTRVAESLERGDIADAKSLGTGIVRKVVTAPARAMTAGDIAARDILMKAGFSEMEARRITLTSEPLSAFAKTVGGWSRAKGDRGEKSILGKLMLPFYRTGMNQIEQSLLRTPIGNSLRKSWNMAPVSTKQLAIQSGISGALATGAFAWGANTDPKKAPIILKFLTNFTGPYGATVGVAFMAGVTSQKTNNIKEALPKGAWQYLDKGLPMPSADIIQDWLSFLGGGQPPYGLIPPPLSSKELVSVPTAGRFIAGDPEWKRPTKYERSVAAPFIPNVKLQPKPKTDYQRKLDQIKAERAAQRKEAKERSQR